jgi:hypothetical protein
MDRPLSYVFNEMGGRSLEIMMVAGGLLVDSYIEERALHSERRFEEKKSTQLLFRQWTKGFCEDRVY